MISRNTKQHNRAQEDRDRQERDTKNFRDDLAKLSQATHSDISEIKKIQIEEVKDREAFKREIRDSVQKIKDDILDMKEDRLDDIAKRRSEGL